MFKGEPRAIFDHAGRRARLLTADDLPTDVDRPLLKERVVAAKGWRSVIPVAIALSAGMIAGPALRRLSEGRPPYFPDIGTKLVVAGTLTVAMGVFQQLLWRRRSRAAVAACLSHELCPSCGYGLASICPDAQGFTRCPECGASWCVPAVPEDAAS